MAVRSGTSPLPSRPPVGLGPRLRPLGCVSLSADVTFVLDYWTLFFFSSRRRYPRFDCDWSSDVCSSDLATPKAGVAVADLEAAIDAQLHRLIEHGVEADEVTRAARRMQAAAIYAHDSLAGPANIIGAALAIGQSLDDVTAWPDKIGAVTPAEVEAAARAV